MGVAWIPAKVENGEEVELSLRVRRMEINTPGSARGVARSQANEGKNASWPEPWEDFCALGVSHQHPVYLRKLSRPLAVRERHPHSLTHSRTDFERILCIINLRKLYQTFPLLIFEAAESTVSIGAQGSPQAAEGQLPW